MDGRKMKLKQPLTTSEARSLEPVLQRQLQKLQAPRSLIAFTKFTFPRYDTAGLHRHIAEQLERVERGEIDRLMLLVPPRHGKSELASRRFPAWFLGRDPTRHFISASASFSLAEEFRFPAWPMRAANTFVKKRGSGSPARPTTGWKKMVR